MKRYDIDCIVIGAGVVGLACAAALAKSGLGVIVLEAAAGIGAETSSRNSEVIHAGLYYPTGSLKHLLCVEGRRRLYPYLEARGVAFRKCQKLIVAARTEEEPKIEALHATATKNGVEHVRILTGVEARALEPNLHCTLALLSEETGIMDSHGFMLALQGEMEDHGGAIAFQCSADRIEPANSGGFQVWAGGEAILARLVVNCAGLFAHQVAARIEGLDSACLPAFHLAKGAYFSCAGKPAYSRLIYPAPVDGGLGVHVTLDLAGRMRFGPDVEWLGHNDPARIDYAVDPKRSERFYEAVRRYWPGLPDGAIQPDYAGCRPKLSGPGEPAADFRIDGPETHGLDGLVNLFGIESPGLTSALAIADCVLARLNLAQASRHV